MKKFSTFGLIGLLVNLLVGTGVLFAGNADLEKIYPFEAAVMEYNFEVFMKKGADSEKLVDQGKLKRFINNHGADDTLEISKGQLAGFKMLLYKKSIKEIHMSVKKCTIIRPKDAEIAMVIRYIAKYGDDRNLQNELNYKKTGSETILGNYVNVYEGGPIKAGSAKTKITESGVVMGVEATGSFKQGTKLTIKVKATKFNTGSNNMVDARKFTVPPGIKCFRK